jgi:hypothetical protein
MALPYDSVGSAHQALVMDIWHWGSHLYFPTYNHGTVSRSHLKKVFADNNKNSMVLAQKQT